MNLKQLLYVDEVESTVKPGQIPLVWIKDGQLLKGATIETPRSGNLNQNPVALQKNIQILDENITVLNDGLNITDEKLQKIIDDLGASTDQTLVQTVSDHTIKIDQNTLDIKTNKDNIEVEKDRINDIKNELGVPPHQSIIRDVYDDLFWIKQRIGNKKDEDINGEPLDGDVGSGLMYKTEVAIESSAQTIKAVNGFESKLVAANDKIITETERAISEENKISNDIDNETERAKTSENYLQSQINTIGTTGGRGYKTYALMDADKYNIKINTVSKVTNDPDDTKNGDWQWDGNTFTRSHYDAVIRTELPIVLMSNLYSGTNKSGFYVRPSDGFIIASASNELTVVEVKENTTYSISAADMRTQYFICSYSDTPLVTGGKQNTLAVLENTNDPLVKTFTVPAGMKYIFINTVWPNFNFNIKQSLVIQKGTTIKKAVKTALNVAIIDQIAQDRIDGLEFKGLLTKGDIFPSNTGPVVTLNPHNNLNIAPSTGSIRTSENCKISRFDITPLKRYKIKSTDFRSPYVVVSVSTTKDIFVGAPQTLMPLTSIDETTKIFTAPEGMISACINTVWPNFGLDIESSLVIEELDMLAITNVDGVPIVDTLAHKKIKDIEDREISGGYTSVLKGKSWVFIGDSITDSKNDWATSRYFNYVVDSVGGMITQNLGISSSGYGDRTIAADAITIENPDYITLFMGTNDFGYLNQLRNSQGKPYPMGDFLSSTNLTVSGAINLTLTNLFNKFPFAKIAIITPLPRGTRAGGEDNPSPNFGENPPKNVDGVSLEDVTNELIRYAKHYSLPVLDLYHHSNFQAWSEVFQEARMKDGVHPNKEGHLIIGQKILKLLESM